MNLRRWTGLLILAMSGNAQALTFDATISPPRFELRTKPGKVVREVFKITNSGADLASYSIKSADWGILQSGQAFFHEGQPLESSCRPWLKLQSRSIDIGANQWRNFRYEVHVPEDAPDQQCRIAILVSQNTAKTPATMVESINIPVAGRIAVIIYLSVGDAKPDVRITELKMGRINEKDMPAVVVKNVGNAHARLSGTLNAVDADGKKLELMVGTNPILPGAESTVVLQPVEWDGNQLKAMTKPLKLPLQLKGRIDWEGGNIKMDYQLSSVPLKFIEAEKNQVKDESENQTESQSEVKKEPETQSETETSN